MRIERLKVYINAQNLATFTDYSGYDPEIGAFQPGSLYLQNVDMGRYPSAADVHLRPRSRLLEFESEIQKLILK